jgi:hypothetical protein
MKIERKITQSKNKGKKIDVLCSECHRETDHLIVEAVNVYSREEYDSEFSVDGATDYQIIECQGCHTFSFRTDGWFSEGDGRNINLYPRRSEDELPVKDLLMIARKTIRLRKIYREVIHTYNNEQYTLCAAGLRSIIEGICVERNISDGQVEYTDKNGDKKTKRFKNLQGKIAGLAEKGVLTNDNAEILHELRFLGNKALHELATPQSEELQLGIKIIEHILENIYDLPSKAKELKAFRPEKIK